MFQLLFIFVSYFVLGLSGGSALESTPKMPSTRAVNLCRQLVPFGGACCRPDVQHHVVAMRF